MDEVAWLVTAQRAAAPVARDAHRTRGRERPEGTRHARRQGAPRTACGLSARGWPTFPHFTFPPGGAVDDLCEYCVDAVRVETVTRRAAEEFQNRMIALVESQAGARGDWPDPRDAVRPSPPWPSRSNVVLEYLLWRAEIDLDEGNDQRAVLERLATTAWFEGGVANYDRGQRDGRGHPSGPNASDR